MSTVEVIALAQEEGRSVLTEVESKNLLKGAGIEVVDTRLARTKREAISISSDMGFPVVLKIASPDVVHKSDAGGVKVGLKNASQAGRAYSEIMTQVKQKFPRARIQGVAVQKMAPPGVEVIIGMSKDPQFGPVIMFGLGGVLVEVLKDVSFRIVPLAPRDAHEMVQEIKGYPLLCGYRGQDPVDIGKLEEMILKVSDFVEWNPEIAELDLNPVFAYKDGTLAVDARIILEKADLSQ
jgi:acyl-CoA synthetase (NDP forming)